MTDTRSPDLALGEGSRLAWAPRGGCLEILRAEAGDPFGHKGELTGVWVLCARGGPGPGKSLD